MCGIVGILGRGPVADLLVDSLKRLEYRGYDSAGVATLEGSEIVRRRAEGKLKNLEKRLSGAPLDGHIGIGHTRWATHGKPTENNAHPHATDNVAVVHNGIIENFRELRAELEKQGATFSTETDTEVAVHLVNSYLARGLTPEDAVKASLPQLRGAFALGFVFRGHDNLIIGARKGAPLAIGYGDGEMYLGSDAIALAPLTDTISYLEDGDWVVLTRTSAVIRNEDNGIVRREVLKSGASSFLVDKANYRHFMAKEIHEQPEVVGHTLARYVDMAAERIALPQDLPFDLRTIERISITACGTASYAGYVARYWFERLARLPVDIDIASEFRYREAPLRKGDLAIFISQSGETADTLAALRYAKEQGLHTLSVVNVLTSTIARESEVVLPTLAGPEIGVASTKAFTCQLTVLASLAIAAGKARGVLSGQDEARLAHALIEVPRLMAQALTLEPQIEKLARDIAKSKDVLYLGRGTSYPLALEGALKLKEISYIHAEGYAAGELKHGPIALIDEHMPVVVIAPYDRVFEKTVSNMQEVAARGGRIILMTDAKGAAEATVDSMVTITLPDMPATVTPLVYAIPVQLLAYHTAVIMGTDVDQPRNLAKSVTVE
ncbi:glutamine--fructose-6-phosphate transaminase (isomerizing) [Bradyrhizobium sp. U87765 SZCCT0131]|uniref:glutamine--fructose-6-phosphate transaminase (isomerizing) n=1 Tax=unclassified Bradyrhizobium TaxID=2631580 RepID=UPI001BA961FA|nr:MULTISPECIES: glutamine--fructose-6-phosphate transaminase (isomerizing) [unclassified Bradyrhizobium]MBR1220156.1 glutamine--fructose-6-phosphate transaminase (isomerizing) [Bradyrhizobium sp. U87765 SZCCT0131]MBR1263388.1 glutamine--fructose-6-phosphate transaminase (isomerizing) [Bradyrhizobium sp. U87765 SZCCT0134]MBR1306729.1 glutamine--fructose-6-phosphate transaminase (isomerizing) [Bradyrhizobium sp. U87765 SZCCT0110]MBR1323228.1 glutamine--fructose-6-phosphate transaminase (isomeriz